MKQIAIFTYDDAGRAPLGHLHALADRHPDGILCRVRRSKDHVLLLHHEPDMARLCLCADRIEDLTFAEIRALMRLDGREVLTFAELMEGYATETPLILHFRGFRADAEPIRQVVQDRRFSLGTDSPEQLSVILDGYPTHRATGFACYFRAAAALAEAGAASVCLYGREPARYARDELAALRDTASLLFEMPLRAEERPSVPDSFDGIVTL